MDRLKNFFNRNRKSVAHEEFEMKKMGESSNKDASIADARYIKKAPESRGFFNKIKNILFGKGKLLSDFKASKASVKNRVANPVIKQAAKETQQVARELLQKQGYSGSELKKIMTNLKNIPDEYYLDAAGDIPQKNIQDLGYTSKLVANNDFSEALVELMNAGFRTKDAELAILHARDNADKNNFRKSFKEIISSRIADAIGSQDHLHEEDKKFMLSWAMKKLTNKNILFDNQLETQHMLEDIYLNVSKEYSERPSIHINSIFMEKIHEIIQQPPPRNEE